MINKKIPLLCPIVFHFTSITIIGFDYNILKASFNDVPNPWDLACPTASPTRQRIPSYAARAWQSTLDIVPFLADASSPSPNLVG